jgi:predicted amidohydrolase YtcJ
VVVTAGLSLILSCALTNAQQPRADIVMTNGYVYTVDRTHRVAEAIAIDDGRIVYVGNDTDARRYIGDSTKTVDLRGRMVMPGIHDGHLHPLGLGRTLTCSLNYEPLTMAEVRERIMDCLERSSEDPPDSLLRVYSWGPLLPAGTQYSKADLDLIPTERPISMRKSYGHLSLVNSPALELAGITAATPDPPGGEIKRDAQGNPTGVLIDSAQRLGRLAAPPTPEENVRFARGATEALIAQGGTSFLDTGAGESSIQAMKTLRDAGELPVRANFAIRIRGARSRGDAGAHPEPEGRVLGAPPVAGTWTTH